MEKYIDKIKLAVMALLKIRPYFASLVLRFQYMYDEDNPSLSITKTGVIRYGEMVNNVTDEQLMALLYHESLHIFYQHFDRLASINNQPGIQNIVFDLEINDNIRQEKFELPEGCLYPELFKLPENLLAEEYYELLKQKAIQINIVSGSDGNNSGSDKNNSESDGNNSGLDENNSKSDGNKSDKKQQKQKGKGKSFDISDKVMDMNRSKADEKSDENANTPLDIQMAIESVYDAMQKHEGKLPEHFQRAIDSKKQIMVDWRSVVRNMMNSKINILKSSGRIPTYNRLSRRMHMDDIMFPNKKQNIISMGIVIDTSGSVSKEELSQYMSDIYNLCSKQQVDMIVVPCDAEVQNVSYVKNTNDLKKIKLSGGGGTDLIKGIEKCHQLKYNGCVVFTDGEYTWPSSSPINNITVIVLNNNESVKKEQPSWGRFIYVPIK